MHSVSNRKAALSLNSGARTVLYKFAFSLDIMSVPGSHGIQGSCSVLGRDISVVQHRLQAHLCQDLCNLICTSYIGSKHQRPPLSQLIPTHSILLQ